MLKKIEVNKDCHWEIEMQNNNLCFCKLMTKKGNNELCRAVLKLFSELDECLISGYKLEFIRFETYKATISNISEGLNILESFFKENKKKG